MVVADDRRGGIAKQEFNITLIRIEPEKPTYNGLVIVSSLMGALLIVVVALICKRQCKCKGKKKAKKDGSGTETEEQATDEDTSFDEDDDIIIADIKPKNPFKLIADD